MADIVIRPAGPDDLQEVSRLYHEIQALHHDAEPGLYLAPSETVQPAAWLRERFAGPAEVILIATDNEEVLGLVHVKICDTPENPFTRPRRFALVEAITVSPSRQRAGVGSKLMAGATDWARAQGVTRLELGVRAFNTGAMAFYDRLGFTTTMHRLARSIEEEDIE